MALYRVQSNGKAPTGLQAGDEVVTGGGTYRILGVNADGSYRIFRCLKTLGSIDRVPRFFIKETITAAQCQAQQEARKYISELFHICQSIKGSI